MALLKRTDNAGALVAAYEYDAFGQTLRESGSHAAANPFRFSTKYTDTETNLVYYGHRYYSPWLGRFINRDPISESGGLNLYAFVGNNGVNRWDYLGMVMIDEIILGPWDDDEIARGFNVIKGQRGSFVGWADGYAFMKEAGADMTATGFKRGNPGGNVYKVTFDNGDTTTVTAPNAEAAKRMAENQGSLAAHSNVANRTIAASPSNRSAAAPPPTPAAGGSIIGARAFIANPDGTIATVTGPAAEAYIRNMGIGQNIDAGINAYAAERADRAFESINNGTMARLAGETALLAGLGFLGPITTAENAVTTRTTILGENMFQRVIPFAERTGGVPLGFGATPAEWAAMTPAERFWLNDGMLRARINAGESFRYIGQDVYRNPALRTQFDLTASELLRLNSRNIPYETVPAAEVQKVLGRP